MVCHATIRATKEKNEFRMVLKRFSVAVFTRTIILCLSVSLLIYLITNTSFVATPLIVALLVIAQFYLLVQYVQKTNRDIARFFDSIRYSDFSQSFRPTVKGSSFEELNNAFSKVIEQFRKTRGEKEEQYRYLQIVVQHVGIGLMAFTPDGNLELINTAAKKLLRVDGVHNISELRGTSTQLVGVLEGIKAGESLLAKYISDNELFQISIYATEFKMQGKQYKLVSLANIQNELEEREMQAWQNLIRVLTHEIMNSVTPIISLSSTASSLLEGIMKESSRDIANTVASNTDDGTEEAAEPLNDVKGALDTISKRSQGLLHFVDDYRNLTRIPTPNFQTVKIDDLFARIQKLFADRFEKRGISFSATVSPKELELSADPDLIEQVVINLIMNSIGALANRPTPEIRLVAKTDNRGGTLIQVIDNGHGIPEELHDKIFIPFFTTRKEGSGIGLSLSRQIMRAHKGSITVISSPEKETTFTLRF